MARKWLLLYKIYWWLKTLIPIKRICRAFRSFGECRWHLRFFQLLDSYIIYRIIVIKAKISRDITEIFRPNWYSSVKKVRHIYAHHCWFMIQTLKYFFLFYKFCYIVLAWYPAVWKSVQVVDIWLNCLWKWLWPI